MTKPERLENFGIRFPRSLTEELDAKAKEMDCSRSVLIRSILWDFLNEAKIIRLDEYMAESADAQFRISVARGTPTEGEATVMVEATDADYTTWRLACEYFLSMTAKKSGIEDFDEALCVLCDGADKYENKILRLHDV